MSVGDAIESWDHSSERASPRFFSRVSLCLALDQGQKHRRSHFASKIVPLVYDVDYFGITWAEAAQFLAYRFRLVFVVEHLPTLVIG
jgi:predicted glycosyl hydrolase (DUF1957 family)